MKHSTLWQTTHRSRIPSVQSFFSPFIFGKKYLPQNYFFWYRYIWLQVISSFPLIFRWLNIYACFFSIKFPENKKNHPTLPPPSPTKKKNTTERRHPSHLLPFRSPVRRKRPRLGHHAARQTSTDAGGSQVLGRQLHHLGGRPRPRPPGRESPWVQRIAESWNWLRAGESGDFLL